MSRRIPSIGILSALICLLILAISIGAGRVRSVMAAGLVIQPGSMPAAQIQPTVTPQIVEAGEALMTNPVLLQVMILLSLAILFVIFWGVWINRQRADR